MSHTPAAVPPPTAGYQAALGNSFHASYGSRDDVWSGEPAMREVVPLLLARLRPASHVIDVGAGRGRDTLALLQAGHRVDALDLVATPEWPGLLEQWAGRCAFVQGELMTAPLERVYDAVLDNGCLHHQHPDAYVPYLRRLHAHTVAGGMLVASFFTPAGDAAAGTLWMQHDGRLTRDFTEVEVRELLTSTGWRVERVVLVPRESAAHHYLAAAATRREE